MLKKLIGPLLIIVAVGLVYFLIKNKSRPETKEVESTTVNTLLVTKIKPEQHPIVIQAEGFVSSKWQTNLSSQVSGKVVEVSEKLLVGNQFNQGDVLLKVEPLDYQVQLARSQANLSAAESNLIEQEMQSSRAKSDWNKLNPNRKPSDFNLRIPQLKSAQSNLQAAQNEFKLAQENLSRTQIKAPFDGFSITRSVDLGEQLQIGGMVAEIVDRRNLELKVSLTTGQMAMLEQANDIDFQLNTGERLVVSAIRFEPFIDSQNRWRSVVLELNYNENSPLIGDFLNLSITTNQTNNMLAVPESALSIDGRIWYVDDSNKSQFFHPEIIYKNSGVLYLITDNNLPYPLSLVVAPPNSLFRGTEVATELLQSKSEAEPQP